MTSCSKWMQQHNRVFQKQRYSGSDKKSKVLRCTSADLIPKDVSNTITGILISIVCVLVTVWNGMKKYFKLNPKTKKAKTTHQLLWAEVIADLLQPIVAFKHHWLTLIGPIQSEFYSCLSLFFYIICVCVRMCVCVCVCVCLCLFLSVPCKYISFLICFLLLITVSCHT